MAVRGFGGRYRRAGGPGDPRGLERAARGATSPGRRGRRGERGDLRERVRGTSPRRTVAHRAAGGGRSFARHGGLRRQLHGVREPGAPSARSRLLRAEGRAGRWGDVPVALGVGVQRDDPQRPCPGAEPRGLGRPGVRHDGRRLPAVRARAGQHQGGWPVHRDGARSGRVPERTGRRERARHPGGGAEGRSRGAHARARGGAFGRSRGRGRRVRGAVRRVRRLAGREPR